jgi:hypothetical protein
METKKLEEFLDLKDEEFEFVKDVRKHLDAILERDFDIWNVRVGIGIFDVLVYVCPQSFVFRMYENKMKIFKADENDDPLTEMVIELINNEIYNNIADKIKEKNKNYLSVKLLELTKIED